LSLSGDGVAATSRRCTPATATAPPDGMVAAASTCSTIHQGFNRVLTMQFRGFNRVLKTHRRRRRASLAPPRGVGSEAVRARAAPRRTAQVTYSDEKVANRDIRVWHFVIENGY
jgi:hypothetical protein